MNFFKSSLLNINQEKIIKKPVSRFSTAKQQVARKAAKFFAFL
jgi:hypothetical protein